MENKNKIQIELVDMMIEHEQKIGELYTAYAKKFPEFKDFWSQLVQEEGDHAGLLNTLYSKIGQGVVFFEDGRFPKKGIQISLDYVKEQTERAKKGEVELINALSVAVDLEKSLLESKCFEVFESDTVELKNVLQKLADDTKEHAVRIENLLRKIRSEKNIV
ncbi:hypothetical protein ACFL1Y_01395 [Patescibacteria group bacterium]